MTSEPFDGVMWLDSPCPHPGDIHPYWEDPTDRCALCVQELVEQAGEAGRKEVYDKLLGTEPCPECGTGIVAGCLGCKIRRLEATLNQRVRQGVQEQRERADRLEAALTQAHLALQGAWALLPPEDGEKLGIRRLMLECERPECAALAAQPAQEQKQPAKCCDCPSGMRWAGQYGEGMCYCKCHEEGQR